MAVFKLSCNNTVANGTLLHILINLNVPSDGTNSTSAQDSMGAMRFTIAVVLVYGVGVIGLLGISARRNRRLELMDKEVNKFIKSKLSKYEERRAKKPKRTIYKLITSLHSIIQSDDPDGRLNPKLKSQLMKGPSYSLYRANTWSGHVTADKSIKTNKVTCDSMNLDAAVIKSPPKSCTTYKSASSSSNPSSVHEVLINCPPMPGTIHDNDSCHSNHSPVDASSLQGGSLQSVLKKLYEENNPTCNEDKVFGAGLKIHEGSKKVVTFKEVDTLSMDSTITYV